MLQSLHIENYALIDRSDIVLDRGFTAITGETGAGKSIMLGALSLLLGQRADTKVLFDKERKCVVEASFAIGGLGLQPLFADHDIDYDDLMLLRREILPSGKSRAFINDSPVALPLMREVGERVVDIHSQHQTLLLGNADFQLSLLDSVGDAEAPLAEYRTAYQHYTNAKRILEQLTAQEAQARRDIDYNRFLFDELDKAHLQPDEQQDLENEARLLAGAEEVQQTIASVLQMCGTDSDTSALSALSSAHSLLGRIGRYSNAVDELTERLSSSLIELRDIMDSLQGLNDSLHFSPQRQAEVNDRLDLIYRLQRKHGVNTVAELLGIRDSLDQQLQNADGMDEQIRQAMEQVDSTFALVQQLGERQTALRQSAATYVEAHIQPLLEAVGMRDATLQVRVETLSDYTPSGCNRATFLFNANKGGELRELAKVASGGEMSRLMLAIKAILSSSTLLPTIIFDEIDSGISGDISVKVGQLMQRMSAHMQVVAITHMPQIAARASSHLKVRKGVKQTDSGERTISHIAPLSEAERVVEVATMLSADPPTEAALQTARELMNSHSA